MGKESNGRKAAPPTWEELEAALYGASAHPEDACWTAYRYLAANYAGMGSREARTLLATIMKLPHTRPSALHSCILSVAVKMSRTYPDFRFAAFFELWGGFDACRVEDRQMAVVGGKRIPPLAQRVQKALELGQLRSRQPAQEVVPMVAVKVWEKETDGHKHRWVKLVGADGRELSAGLGVFADCRQADIRGRLFDVLVAGDRALRAVPSAKGIEEVIEPVVGYVECFDAGHSFHHIYDSLSRHFVAAAPEGAAEAGGFVAFCPVVPQRDRFKSAVITSRLSLADGLRLFGTYEATVLGIDADGERFAYTIDEPLRPTPEGEIYSGGTAPLSVLRGAATVKEGQRLRLLLFLKRCKDKVKRNHVALAVPIDKPVDKPIDKPATAPAAAPAANPAACIASEPAPLYGAVPMVAVKVFDGQWGPTALLVGADGGSLRADARLLCPAPMEAEGRLFDVVARGGSFVQAAPSGQRIEDVFPLRVGYVDTAYTGCPFYNVYDPQSRHYLATYPGRRADSGQFVEFCPVEERGGKFRNAVIVRPLPDAEGLARFGSYAADVLMANQLDGYYTYRITEPLRPMAVGKADTEGLATIFAEQSNLCDDDKVRIVLILKKGPDGRLRNYVPRTFPPE